MNPLSSNFGPAGSGFRESPLPIPQDLVQLCEQGERWQQAGQLEEAAAAYRKVLHLHPGFAPAHRELGNCLLQLGRASQAAEGLREAIRLDPSCPASHYYLGIALQQTGLLEAAAASFRQSLALRWDEAPAHHELANTLSQLGRSDEAIASYQEALRLMPVHPLAQNNLANLLSQAGRLEEAILLYQAAIRTMPNYAHAYFNLGHVYWRTGRVVESIHSYQRGLELQPGEAIIHSALGNSFLDLGRIPEAVAHFREAFRLDPSMVETITSLVDKGLAGAAGIGIGQLRQLLATSAGKPEDAYKIHFALGKLLDEAGSVDEAFAHFRQGNALRRSDFVNNRLAFDPAAHRRFVDRLLQTFTSAYFERVRGFGLETEVPVFIVGMPRSGSTLVEQILSSHPDVFGAGEIEDFGSLAESLPARLGTGEPYPECVTGASAAALRSVAEAYLQRLVGRCAQAARVTDKLLVNFFHLGLVATLFPRARIVHCRRDPLDVCLSCYFNSFGGLIYSYDLEELGHYYRQYERLMAHWRAVLPIRIHEVRYEELVAEPEKVSRDLVDYCGLSWDPGCLRFHENPRPVQTASRLQVRQPVYRSSVGRWRAYAVHLEPLRQVLEHMGA